MGTHAAAPVGAMQSGRVAWGAGAAAALALAAFGTIPYLLHGSQLVVSVCVLIAIFATMSYGVDLLLSYLGEVSLGHPIFFAAGAYAAGYGSTRLDLDPWSTLAIALALCLAIGGLIGLATLRVREFIFSVVTYASTIVVGELVFNSAALGGSEGITAVPLLLFPLPFGSYEAGTNLDLWPVAFAVLLLTVYFVSRFRRSALGRRALMVHLNPNLATSLGINVRLIRLYVFIISAPITGVAGWLYAYQRGYVGPDLFQPYFLILSLTAIILFGRRQLLGPLFGTAVVLIQENFLSIGGDGNKVVLGLILIAALVLLPQGLARGWSAARKSRSKPEGGT